MSEISDDDIDTLVSREQRAFRRIMFAGIGMLMLLMVLSLALGIYYFFAIQKLQETNLNLRKQVHEVQRGLNDKLNNLSDGQRDLQASYDDIYRTFVAQAETITQTDLTKASQAASDYLRQGTRISFSSERVMRSALQGKAAAPAGMRSLIEGVMDLVQFDRQLGAERYTQPGQPEPALLVSAQAHFAAAGAGDPRLQVDAHAGLAGVLYRLASSRAELYQPSRCTALMTTVAQDDAVGPQPLLWSAQCQRRMGLTKAALHSYARAVETSAPQLAGIEEQSSDQATAIRNNARQAFHGLGTTLIAAHELPDAQISKPLEVARSFCIDRPIEVSQNQRMDFAVACLQRAIRLRRELGETDAQIAGTQENLGFAYMFEGRFNEALENAENVQSMSPVSSWNQLVLYLAAGEASKSAMQADARGEIALFRSSEFPICELRRLLNDDLFEKAQSVIGQTHRGFTLPRCPKSS